MKRKRIFSFILCAAMLLGLLSGCGGESADTPDVSDVPVSNGEPAATPIAGEMPADEYERAVWYGFLPDELAGADPDNAVVTWKQYCAMLGRMIALYDESKLPEWEEMTADAPDTEMRRDGAMVSLLFAAKTMGIATFNFHNGGENMAEYAERVWDVVTMDYPVFDWDTPIDLGEGCSDNNHVGPAYDFCLQRISLRNGCTLLEFDEYGDLKLEHPLTQYDAAVSVLRLYESDIPYTTERTPTWQDEALLAEVAAKKQAILSSPTEVDYTGTAYYVSNCGSDKNDGRSPETAWATLAKVNAAKEQGLLQYGDAVFFERGGLWRDYLDCAKGVTYSAYGEGEKPKIYGSPENGAGGSNWELWYDDGSVNIWKYAKPISEVGCIVLNDGEECGYRVYAYFNGEEWVVSGADPRPFDIVENLSEDMQFYSTFELTAEQYQAYQKEFNDTTVYADQIDTTGELYFRCDSGNPGELYDSIEFLCAPDGLHGYIGLVTPSGDNVIDNLCLRYCVVNGIAIYGEDDLNRNNDNNIIQNCEIGWMGGDQHNFNWDTGNVMVCGEAIVFKTDNNIIRNNYIYQAAQGTFVGEFVDNEWVPGETQSVNNLIEGNVAENGQYCFWFLDNAYPGEDIVFWDTMTIRDNYILNMGECWHNDDRVVYPGKRSGEEDDPNVAWHFDVWTNIGGIRNWSVTDNVFYLSAGGYLIDTEGEPYDIKFSGNTYVQHDMRNILPEGCIGTLETEAVQEALAVYLGEENAILFN